MMSFQVTNWAVWMHVSASILGFLLYVASTHALQQRRHPAAAMSWILSFIFVPYLALPAYVFFGQRKIKAGASPRIEAADSSDVARSWMSAMLESLGSAPPRDDAHVQVHRSAAQGEASLWQLIEGAQQRIFVSTYVLGANRVGRSLIARLAAKARAGVEVRLLLDGVGCFRVRSRQLRALTRSGGQVARAFPPLRRLLRRQANFRNHRKLLVVDSRALWMGGRNFSDEYFEGNSKHPGWLDLSLDAAGAIAGDAERVFCADWMLATGQRIESGPPAAPSVVASPQAQLLASGPDQSLDSLEALLVTACFRAQKRIIGVTPYLILDPALLQALCLAARRNVSVHLVLPARSNHRLADYARGRGLRELAMAGVSIWLAPQMIHAKAMVFDDFALTGSANLDIRSLFLNFELTMVLYDPDAAQSLADWIVASRAGARLYLPRPASVARDLFEGAVLWLGFQL